MKRKELQALCKEHGIRANLTNVEMASRLAVLFKVYIPLEFLFCFIKFVQVLVVFLLKFGPIWCNFGGISG